MKELVEDKIDPIFKEEYQENTSIKLFKVSIEVIRHSIDKITECYYLPYNQDEKEKFIKEAMIQISEWKNKIQIRKGERKITRLDRVLSKKIIDIQTEYLESLEETDIARRQSRLYHVDAVAAITNLHENRRFASPERKPVKRKIH